MTPTVPIHILLLRGRVPGTERIRGNRPATGRPAAMASTTWVRVLPTANQANLRLLHQEQTLPGKTLQMELALTDPDGKPLDGIAILWLVDRAVLALGEERFLDPLDLFIDTLPSSLRFRETRNMVVGNLPIEENPGGGGDWEEAYAEQALLDRATVRKNFQTVPYYNPRVEIKNGRATVDIPIPDNLTEFAVRAVALSGFSRFATARSEIAVRLPVIVQSAMPRFVRPGDSFIAGAIGRVVEGPGGPGSVEVLATGMLVNGAEGVSERIELAPALAMPVVYPFTVPTTLEGGATVTVRFGIERLSDHALDAFEISLPVRHSVHRVTETFTAALKKGDPAMTIPVPSESFQPGSARIDLTAAVNPALLSIVTGLSFLSTYPHGCVEQRVSMMYPLIALQGLLSRMGLADTAAVPPAAFAELMKYLREASTERGLFSFWPGTTGYVSLTSYVLEFLVKAQALGYEVPPDLIMNAQSALREALRSDYEGFIPGQSFRERVDALFALGISGSFDITYAYDLLADALGADLYSQARLLELFSLQGRGNEAGVKRLRASLESRISFNLVNRQKVFAGLRYDTDSWGGLIVSSETRTLSHVIKALHMYGYADISYLVDELLKRGGPNGWGSTISTVAALDALNETLADLTGKPLGVSVSSAEGKDTIDLSKTPLVRKRYTNRPPYAVSVVKGTEPVHLLARLSYLPLGSGAALASVSQGYGVQTVLHLYRDEVEVNRLVPKAGQTISFEVGDIVEIEGILRLSAPATFVAFSVPFAAGFEPLNPGLATAPREAPPAGTDSREADYTIYGDDAMTWYFNEIGKGEYRFFFRVRASFPGTFIQPPGTAENLYDARFFGRGEGTRILIMEKE